MDQFKPDLLVTYTNSLQIITFNKPNKRNAFGEKIYKGVKEALRLASLDENVTMTVLTGTGEYYSSGNDLSAFNISADFAEFMNKKLNQTKDFIDALIDYPKLLVALVNGPAIGIAVTTLALCDMVFAADTATFHTPFVSLGITAEGCSSYTFPKIMGSSLAGKMLYFNHKMNIEEAKSCGLVGEVFGKQEISKIFKKLETYSKLPSKSLLYTKRLIRDSEKDFLHEVNRIEIERLQERFSSDEAMNAVLDFMMKKLSKL